MIELASLSPEKLDAAEARLEEIVQRNEIRTSFAAWARHRGYKPAAHHVLMMNEVDAFLENPELDVLMFHMPPGSAKSTYLSWLLSPHYFANFPQNNILFATHSDDFAQRWGRRVRNTIAEEGLTLGIQLSSSSAASDAFALEQGGEYYAVGAGKGISGFRFDLGICDDLFGSREDAWSDTVRRKRWDWFRDDFSPRRKPGAKRILVNTRWHDEDVAGRMVALIKAEKIRGRIIDIQAEATENDPLGREPGQFLWDDDPDYPYGQELRTAKAETSPMMWAAMYQQRPAPEDGEYWKAEWLRPYKTGTAPPRDQMRIYGASDYAVTADSGDPTVHGVLGIDPEGRPWLLDLWRRQASSDVWVEAFCDLVLKHKPLEWAEEKGQITSGVGPYLSRRQRERKAYVVRTQFPTRGDKATRAQSMRGYVAQHGLWIPEDAPWYADFRAELMSFPAGKHDDQHDMLGLLGQLLDKMLAGQKPRPKEKPKRDAWDRAFGRLYDQFDKPDSEPLNWKCA